MSVRTILAPIDGSEPSDRLLEQAHELLPAGSQVVLLRVVEPRGEREPAQAHRERVDGAWSHLERLRERLVRRGVDARALLQEGDPERVILEAAEREGASLVAMTTHGRSGLSRWLHGSVAERVLRRSDVPLLLANPRALLEEGHQRLLVPLDGSAHAAAVLPLVLELARAFRAPVTLFRVSPDPPVPLDHPLAVPPPTPDELAAGLEGARRELEAAGLDVRVGVTYGPTAAEVVAEAGRVPGTLVVLATHGRTGVSRALYGSIAEELLRACPCPVLIQRVAPAGEASSLEGGPRVRTA